MPKTRKSKARIGNLISICLVVVGLINFIPVLGIFSANNLASAYAIALTDNNLIILMRHRAMLFGVLGGFVLYSVYKPVYQKAAMLMAGISMVGFALLTISVGDYNEAVYKVLLIDLVGIIFLMVGFALKLFVAKHYNK